MTLKEKQQAIIEDFSMYEDWLDKYEYLIELGKSLEGLPEEKKTEDRLIKGCQSRVWLDCRKDGDQLVFSADSDALITRGIIAMLVQVYSGSSAEAILSDDFSFLDQLGLKENLSPTRSNGLVSMIAQIRAKAAENE